MPESDLNPFLSPTTEDDGSCCTPEPASKTNGRHRLPPGPRAEVVSLSCDTPGCTAEGCAIRDLAAEFEKRNTVVFGVSFDEEPENAAFVEKHDFPFALLCDTDREVGLAYGACKDESDGYAERFSFLIDEDGYLAQAWYKVDPRKHAQEVLDALDAQAGEAAGD